MKYPGYLVTSQAGRDGIPACPRYLVTSQAGRDSIPACPRYFVTSHAGRDGNPACPRYLVTSQAGRDGIPASLVFNDVTSWPERRSCLLWLLSDVTSRVSTALYACFDSAVTSPARPVQRFLLALLLGDVTARADTAFLHALATEWRHRPSQYSVTLATEQHYQLNW